MRKVNDITNLRFGRLIVLERIKSIKSRTSWLCRCDCGLTKIIRGSNLLTGKTRSCGCLQKEETSKRTVKDLTNMRFGRLFVVKRNRNQGKVTTYLCKCDCGKYSIVRGTSLNTGGVRRGIVSCGCSRIKYHLEPNQKFGRLTNIVVFRNNRGILGWKCKCDCGQEHFATSSQLYLGYVRSCGCLHRDVTKARIGERNYNWNPDLTEDERLHNRNNTYELFTYPILNRDNFKCVICQASGDLNVHHINGYHWYKEGRFDSNNGITLCLYCHRKFHKIYGKKWNTYDQMSKFIGEQIWQENLVETKELDSSVK